MQEKIKGQPSASPITDTTPVARWRRFHLTLSGGEDKSSLRFFSFFGKKQRLEPMRVFSVSSHYNSALALLVHPLIHLLVTSFSLTLNGWQRNRLPSCFAVCILTTLQNRTKGGD